MTATRLDFAPVDDRVARLEARQRELYALLDRLRTAHAAPERIRELILEIDEHDARVLAAQVAPPPLSEYTRPVLRLAPPTPPPIAANHRPAPPEPVDDEPGIPVKRMLVVGAMVVAAAAVLGIFVAGRGSSPEGPASSTLARPAAAPPAAPAAPIPAGGSIPVRLQTHLQTTACGAPNARTSLHWSWTLPPGYDGQQATIQATGPGLAGSLRRTVVAGRVRLAYTSPCLAPGGTWTVSLESVGGTPARLTAVEQLP